MKPLLILRPEPGNRATAARARALGLEARQSPLFEMVSTAWTAPDASGFDHLLLTSANAVRHGGAGLARLRDLSVLAVGPATAAAARKAGFRVARTGEAGVAALLEALPAGLRLLHLSGQDHHDTGDRPYVRTIAVYRARPLDCELPAGAFVALVHSARAGARLAQLAPDRSRIAVAAISAAAAAACGSGWAAIEWVACPDDAALLALAARLCQE